VKCFGPYQKLNQWKSDGAGIVSGQYPQRKYGRSKKIKGQRIGRPLKGSNVPSLQKQTFSWILDALWFNLSLIWFSEWRSA
jgi:hypothetical protein